MPRENREFSGTDDQPWEKVDEGVFQKILSKDDETGAYTRLLKFDPGANLNQLLSHDFYEEVYVVKGTLVDKTLNETFSEGMYAYRNPDMKHGPYFSPSGCMTVEFRYFGLKRKDEN